ncbi:hypothetical protein Y1Q_0008855 [Alligator mississippiensis]|uniref:Uncharacterized protein n=1 Tax=Alligator mississippiensis TaxID=8496 RepID=A0A151NAT8_ALLMI|nr:hypothetical protein Y1Q_0008855 [Alligator mississippiensis]
MRRANCQNIPKGFCCLNQRYLLLPELQPLEKFWQGPCDNAPTREQNELPGWALGLHVNNFSCSVCRFLKHPQVQGELTCFLHFGVGGFRENKCCGRKSMSKKARKEMKTKDANDKKR